MIRDEISLITYRVIRRLLEVRRLVDVAAELGLTQPAVSFHLRRFESHYGYKILKRSGNEMIVTEAGERVLELCRRLLDTLDAFGAVDGERQVAISLPPSFLADLLFSRRIEERLLRQYIWSGGHGTREDLRARRYGLVLRYLSAREERPDLTFDMDMVWVGNQALVNQPRIPIVRLPSSTIFGRLIEEYLPEKAEELTCIAETNDQSFLLEMVRRGDALSYHPPHYAALNWPPRAPDFTRLFRNLLQLIDFKGIS